jgi:hypothetical protein
MVHVVYTVVFKNVDPKKTKNKKTKKKWLICRWPCRLDGDHTMLGPNIEQVLMLWMQYITAQPIRIYVIAIQYNFAPLA